MDRGAWWATVHGVVESDTTEMAKHATHPAHLGTLLNLEIGLLQIREVKIRS